MAAPSVEGNRGALHAHVRWDPGLTSELATRMTQLPGPRSVRVTDLVDPRIAFYRILHPVAVPPEREARMAEGRTKHARVERLLADPRHREVHVSRNGVVGRVDLLEEVPTEIKSTAALPELAALAESRPQYIEQLGMYCGLVDRSEGRLVLVGDGTPGAVEIAVVTCQFRELEELRRRMFVRADRLREAIRSQRAEELPRCAWFHRGCLAQESGVCRCTGSEAPEPWSIRELLVRLEPAPGVEADLRRRWRSASENLASQLPFRFRDLLYPRRAYFERGPFVPAPVGATEAAGAAVRNAEVPSRYERLRAAVESGEPNEVAYAPSEAEMLDEEVPLWHGAPYALKTVRSRPPAGPEELLTRHPQYLGELGLKCAAVHLDHGSLIVAFEPVHPPERSVRVVDVRLESLAAWERFLRERAEGLRRALETGDPQGLPNCPSWMFERCPYRSICGDAPAGTAR